MIFDDNICIVNALTTWYNAGMDTKSNFHDESSRVKFFLVSEPNPLAARLPVRT